MAHPAPSLVLAKKAPGLRLVLIVVALNLLVGTLVAVTLQLNWVREHEQAQRLAASMAAVLEANLVGIVAKVDIALQSATDEAEQELTRGALDKPRFDQFLIRTQSRLPEIASFRAANAEGLALYGPEVPVANTKSLAHRDNFQDLRDHDEKGLVFSQPLVGGITGKWMILFVRRFNHPDGTFAGLVYAGVTLEYLTKAFSAFDTGAKGAIALRDGALGLIDHYPSLGDPAKVVGTKNLDPELPRRIAQGQTSGTVVAAGVTAFTKCGPYPFYVVIDLAEADFLGPWFGRAVFLVSLAGLFLLATVILAIRFSQDANRTRRATQDLLEQDLRIQALLEEKDVILNEVHHRIKNNMAMVAGLLTIQANEQEPDSTEAILLTAANRITSMAVLYDRLFLSENKQDIPIGEYFHSLLSEIQNTYPHAPQIRFDWQVENIVLSARILSTLGIVLNELITNSMKHAFPVPASGTVSIRGKREGERIVLEYRDDGVGYTPPTAETARVGFGLRLIPMLVKQLKGTLTLLPGPGSGVRIEFDPIVSI